MTDVVCRRTDARFASEKQVPRCAQNDRQKSKDNCNCISRFPEGMTERKATIRTREEADPYGMTARKTTANTTTKTTAKTTAVKRQRQQ
jgi:hypothetical protein